MDFKLPNSLPDPNKVYILQKDANGDLKWVEPDQPELLTEDIKILLIDCLNLLYNSVEYHIYFAYKERAIALGLCDESDLEN